MPLLENDLVFAFLNKLDSNHKLAEKVFSKLREGTLEVEFSSVALVEMQLVYRSEKMEERLLEHLSALSALPHTRYVALTPDVAVTSVYLRQTHGLSFFDSHYAASALGGDGEIISFDAAYDKVPGLHRVDPASLV